jgi:hypothetical protein
MQIAFAMLRLAAVVIGIWLIAVFLLALARQGNSELITNIPFASTLEEIPPGPYLREHAFDPAAKFMLEQFKDKSFDDALRDIALGLLTSMFETLFKLTAIDVINILLVGIIVPIFSLILTRLINMNNRRLCSAHLYLVAIKGSQNLLSLLSSVTVMRDGAWMLAANENTSAMLRRLRAEIDVMSDFSIAYQQVFTRRARRHAVPARMCLAPVREVVDLAIAEMERFPTKSINLSDARFKAVMLYRGRTIFVWLWHTIVDIGRRLRGREPVAHPEDHGFLASVAFFIAAGSAIELNFQLAERLEGRRFFVLPASGRVLPRSVRKEHLKPIRERWRKEGFPVIAQRLLKGTREPWLPPAQLAPSPAERALEAPAAA